jgi:hypothetical protein
VGRCNGTTTGDPGEICHLERIRNKFPVKVSRFVNGRPESIDPIVSESSVEDDSTEASVECLERGEPVVSLRPILPVQPIVREQMKLGDAAVRVIESTRGYLHVCSAYHGNAGGRLSRDFEDVDMGGRRGEDVAERVHELHLKVRRERATIECTAVDILRRVVRTRCSQGQEVIVERVGAMECNARLERSVLLRGTASRHRRRNKRVLAESCSLWNPKLGDPAAEICCDRKSRFLKWRKLVDLEELTEAGQSRNCRAVAQKSAARSCIRG